MTPTDLAIPPQMLARVVAELRAKHGYLAARDITEEAKTATLAVLDHQRKNPVVPNDNEDLPILSYVTSSSDWTPHDNPERMQESYREGMVRCLAEWQRRMYLKPAYPADVLAILEDHGITPDKAVFASMAEMAMKCRDLGKGGE